MTAPKKKITKNRRRIKKLKINFSSKNKYIYQNYCHGKKAKLCFKECLHYKECTNALH